MRSKQFVITMAVLCCIMAAVCVWAGVRFWHAFEMRMAFRRAVGHANDDDYDTALAEIDKCIEHVPSRVEPYRCAALWASRLQEPGRALAYYRAMAEHATGEDLAKARLHMGALCLQVAGPDEDEPDAGKLDEAIEHLEKARDAFGDLDEPGQQAKASGMIGIAHALKKDYAGAAPHLDAAMPVLAEADANDLAATMISSWKRALDRRRRKSDGSVGKKARQTERPPRSRRPVPTGPPADPRSPEAHTP